MTKSEQANSTMIDLLADHRDMIPTLSEWYQDEWEHYYGSGGVGDARADLEARCNRTVLPIGLVAMEGRRIMGTAALDLDVTTELTPSLVGLLVGRDHRRRGIAAALIAAAEDLARALGHHRVYVSSAVLGPLLDRRGWKAIGAVEFLNSEPGSVYMLDLPPGG